jgi:hypothetical protein
LIPVNDLEKAVMVQLFSIFGDIDLLKEAVERATPNTSLISELQSRLIEIDKDLDAVQAKIERIVNAVAEGAFSIEDSKIKMVKLREQKSALTMEKDRVETKLSNLPDHRRQVSKLAKLARLAAEVRQVRFPTQLSKMTFQKNRELIQTAFAGTDQDGNRYGVYVSKDEKGQWNYEIRGILSPDQWLKGNFKVGSEMGSLYYTEPTFTGKLPMTKKEAQDIINVDTEYCNFNPLEHIQRGETKFASY